MNLIAGIVARAAHRRMVEYLRDRLFTRLGIEDYRWRLDRAGDPVCMAGLQIRPRDLARIGEMLAERGVWRGRRILSAAWIEGSALTPSQDLNPHHGLLWWPVGGRVEAGPLIDDEGLARLRKVGVDPAFIEACPVNGHGHENAR